LQSSGRLCVIVNPTAGRHRAARRLEKLRADWGSQVDLRETARPGHAEELAKDAALEGFRIVAAAGGDGTVHEVANGLLRAARPEVEFAVIPIGSANDYAHHLKLPDGFVTEERNGVRAVDAAVVRAPDSRERYFVCNLGLGLNGAVTLESRKIQRLQGFALYGLATLRALWYRYGTPTMELTFDDRPPEKVPTLMLSLMLAQREGRFLMAPDAKLDDGWLDYVHSTDLSRWEVIRLLPRLALAGPPTNHPKVRRGRCRRLRLRSEAPLVVHTDGEFFCTPEENVREIEVEVLPAALRVRTNLK
jgi:diacylglycerol kinase (ATP)